MATTQTKRPYHVGVMYTSCSSHDMVSREAFVSDGKMSVGGCLPSPGMLGDILTLPYHLVGGYYSRREGAVCAVLADGSEVKLGTAIGIGCTFDGVTVNGIRYDSVLDAAIKLTPA